MDVKTGGWNKNTNDDMEQCSESDIESDAGASPDSLSESESLSVSSRSSSPEGLRICEGQSKLKSNQKRKPISSPLGSRKGRSSPGQNQKTGEVTIKRSQKGTQTLFIKPTTSSPHAKLALTPPKTPNAVATLPTSTVEKSPPHPQPRRKLKRLLQTPALNSDAASPSTSCKQRKLMNKRRRTKSERNTRAGKVKQGPVQVVVEDSIALDAEIDKVLEEKALKNNLTATNVKSIIRHVMTNNTVQKMMWHGKKKAKNPDDSSDDEACYEPKLTRSRTKLLMGNSNNNNNNTTMSGTFWPLASPAKINPPVASETNVFMNDEELPEDSSGDDYVPNPHDETHSEDESSNVASHASDTGGSPRFHIPSPRSSVSSTNRRSGGGGSHISELTSPKSASCFKTPPPMKPKCVRGIDSAIGQRTRSKLPLNDTALEDLEMQLIPPDITTDMFYWGISDNEDYLGFLKDFERPVAAGTNNNEGGDDEKADPDFNVMEDEEVHDKEELRRDRAVKVTKKELNELFASLVDESLFSSGDELNETDFTSLCASQLSQVSMSNMLNNDDCRFNDEESGIEVVRKERLAKSILISFFNLT